jgi:hypothetical protein
MQAGGLARCAPHGGCRSECELCGSNDDCCSGSCSAQETGQGLCQPSACACGADGETCGADPDCCTGSSCVGGAGPMASRRCAPEGEVSCRRHALRQLRRVLQQLLLAGDDRRTPLRIAPASPTATRVRRTPTAARRAPRVRRSTVRLSATPSHLEA